MLSISIIILLLYYNSLSPPPPITYLPHTHTHTHTQFFGNPGCSRLSKPLWQILPSHTHQSSQSAQGVKKKNKTASSLVWMTLGNLYDLGQKKESLAPSLGFSLSNSFWNGLTWRLKHEKRGHCDPIAHLRTAGEVQALEFRGWQEDWNPPTGTLTFGILPEGGWLRMRVHLSSLKDQTLACSALNLKQLSGRWRSCQGKNPFNRSCFWSLDLLNSIGQVIWN